MALILCVYFISYQSAFFWENMYLTQITGFDFCQFYEVKSCFQLQWLFSSSKVDCDINNDRLKQFFDEIPVVQDMSLPNT